MNQENKIPYTFNVTEAIEENKGHITEEVTETKRLMLAAGIKRPTKRGAYIELLDTIEAMTDNEEYQDSTELYEKSVIYRYLINKEDQKQQAAAEKRDETKRGEKL